MKSKGTNTMAQSAPIQRPSTAEGWSERITALEGELAGAERALTLARTERRLAAGAAAAFGTDPEAVAGLESVEREIERRVDSLGCAVDLARGELAKLEDQNRKAELKARQELRTALVAEIQDAAGAVDSLFVQAAAKLQDIEANLAKFRAAGGIGHNRTLRGSCTRAMLFDGLREFVLTEHCGNSSVIRPLTEQIALDPRADLSTAV